MSLGLRALKISVATFLAVTLASLLNLDYPISAGIIAILSVSDTVKTSWLIAYQRLLSTLLALGIASLLYYFLGYHIFIFALYLLIYVPIAYKLGIEVGIAPCSVLVSHLLADQSVAFPSLTNEVMLMVVGAGIAIIINLYMPSNEAYILELRNQADQKMKDHLLAMSERLKSGAPFQTSQLNDMFELLDKAETLIVTEMENRPWDESNYVLRYLEMRKNQARILQYMQQNILVCRIPMKESQFLARLIYQSAQEFHETNTGIHILLDIELLLNKFRNSPLPETRQEFENRAKLLQIMNDFTRFIQIKKAFYDQYGK